MRPYAIVLILTSLALVGCGGGKKSLSTQSSDNEVKLLNDMETFIPAEVNRRDRRARISNTICQRTGTTIYGCLLYRGPETQYFARVRVRSDGSYTYDAKRTTKGPPKHLTGQHRP